MKAFFWPRSPRSRLTLEAGAFGWGGEALSPNMHNLVRAPTCPCPDPYPLHPSNLSLPSCRRRQLTPLSLPSSPTPNLANGETVNMHMVMNSGKSRSWRGHPGRETGRPARLRPANLSSTSRMSRLRNYWVKCGIGPTGLKDHMHPEGGDALIPPSTCGRGLLSARQPSSRGLPRYGICDGRDDDVLFSHVCAWTSSAQMHMT